MSEYCVYFWVECLPRWEQPAGAEDLVRVNDPHEPQSIDAAYFIHSFYLHTMMLLRPISNPLGMNSYFFKEFHFQDLRGSRYQ
jgi:hypothetical protein